jgi:glycosyltransferase involved in cell wall biosynthesis
MNERPTLSIGLPVRNGEPYLGRTLTCLARQDFEDMEVLIADNGSTDATEDISRAAAAADGRIRYVRHDRDLGATANFNFVFTHTAGEFFAWLAADDEFDPRFYGRMIDLLRKRPEAAAAMSRVRIIDSNSDWLEDADERSRADSPDPVRRFKEMASFSHYCQYSFAVARRRAMEHTRLLLPFWSSDRLYCAELALAGPLVRDPESLFFIRDHEARTTKRAIRNEWDVIRFYLTPSGSRAVTLYYARQLRAAVDRAELSPADRRRANRALMSWGLRNSPKLARSLGRATYELVTQPYAKGRERAGESASIT